MANFIQRILLRLAGSHSRERVADAVWEFLERPDIENVLAILDFRDYETFEIEVPRKYARYIQTFRINDAFLKRALRPYDSMSAIATCIEQLEQYGEENHPESKTLVDKSKNDYQEELRRKRDRYKQKDVIGCPKPIVSEIESKIAILDALEEDFSDIVEFIRSFRQEMVVRGWFHDFLDGLARFEIWIKSGLTTTNELEPFLIQWIEIIGDREKRRIGGATFYESLFQFIDEAGYKDVQDLFRRFGYDISKSFYPEAKFLPFSTDLSKNAHLNHLNKAFPLSMAAELCYQDRSYIKDWVLRWNEIALRERIGETDFETVVDAPKITMNAIVDYVKTRNTALGQLQGIEPYEEKDLSLKFFEDPKTETFAVAFTLTLPKKVTIVAFRGTANLRNWITNLRVDPTDMPDAILPDYKEPITVHEGFLKATQKVQHNINKYLQKQQPKEVYFTGHSLGGGVSSFVSH